MLNMFGVTGSQSGNASVGSSSNGTAQNGLPQPSKRNTTSKSLKDRQARRRNAITLRSMKDIVCTHGDNACKALGKPWNKLGPWRAYMLHLMRKDVRAGKKRPPADAVEPMDVDVPKDEEEPMEIDLPEDGVEPMEVD